MGEEGLSLRSQARYEKILNVAFELFLEHGFEKTSVNEIVRRAGGSLSTLYKFFSTKEKLFEAALVREFRTTFAELEEIRLSEKSIEGFLRRFGRRFFEVICDSKAIALSRVIISEGGRYEGKLGKIFYECGHESVQRVIEEFLRAQQQAGKIAQDIDVSLAALRFIHLVIEPYYFCSLTMGAPLDFTPKEQQKIVDEAVRIFLYGVRCGIK